MDKNSTIGMVIISVIIIVYMTWFAPEPKKETPTIKGTPTATAPAAGQQPNNPASIQPDSLEMAQRRQALGFFGNAASGTQQTTVLQNENIRVTLDNLGGRIDEVVLKKYKTWDKKPLILFDKESSSTDISFKTSNNKTVNLSNLFFTAQPTTNTGNSQQIVYRAAVGPNQYIEQTYALAPNSYLVNYKLNFVGLNGQMAQAPLQFTWNDRLKRVEKDLKQNRDRSYLNYMTAAEDFNYVTGKANEPEIVTEEEPVKWIANKQNFFSAAIIADNSFGPATLKSTFSEADSTEVKTFSSQVQIPMQDVLTGKGNYSFYFGPNDYQILKKLPANFEKNIDLGWGIFSWVNKLLVIPVFNFLQKFFTNYGIIIILLVVFIKMLLLPLTYKSYLSMAKMKVLKPEIDEIKANNEGDMQKTQAETMKLYSSMGVNPMSGCIPMVMQIPILFALLNFFPNSIELRQESFLWANDLSTYDVFARLPFTIPFYGSHISLFTVLMTLSTILYTWSNNQMNSAMQGPMKFYSYLMPFMIMFVVNSFAAGLSLYYFVSNIVTFAQQAIIRRFVDDNKIRAKLEDNQKKNKDKKPGGFQKRLQDAMKAAQEKESQQKKEKRKR